LIVLYHLGHLLREIGVTQMLFDKIEVAVFCLFLFILKGFKIIDETLITNVFSFSFLNEYLSTFVHN
jgi:hypothetical protein